MYISGLPGTGKTAAVRQAIKELREEGMGTGRFTFVEINGMGISNANHIYQILWKAMNPTWEEMVKPNRAKELLKKLFAGGGESLGLTKGVTHAMVLLLDELDCLINRAGQAVLYSLFDWAGSTQSPRRLIIIGLANTMDLPERLPPRIRSRLGTERLIFRPYDHEDMEAILKARLEGLPENLIAPNGLMLCSRICSSQFGDLRRAFQVMRVAIDLTRERKKAMVSGYYRIVG